MVTAPEVAPVPTLADLERRARRDFPWACAHLLKILPQVPPVCPLVLNWPQRYIAEQYLIPAHKRGLPLALSILKARREGISTLLSAWHYHKIRWFRGRRAMLFAHTETSLNEIFAMVTRFHTYLPEELRLPTKALNTEEIEYLGLDSRMGKQVASHKDIGRGQTMHHCHLSEVDFYENPHATMAGVVEAVPATGPSTLILETTANGEGGYFHQHWERLKRQKDHRFSERYWFPLFLPWYWDPLHVATPGRDWEPSAEERDMQQAHRLTWGQVFWYHQKGQELETLHPGRGKRLLKQEYPSTDDEAFIAAGDSIFSEEGRAWIRDHQRPPVLGFRCRTVGDKRVELEACPALEAPLQVWEPPQPGYQYALGVDVSHGLGRDDSAVEVIRMPGFVQVAEWYDNITSPRQLAYVTAAIARYYASAPATDLPYINVEINSIGLLTNDELTGQMQDGEPFQLYVWEPFDRLAPPPVTPASRTGWYTTHLSKNVLIGVANTLLGEQACHVPSGSLQREMGRTYEVRIGVAYTRGADQVMAWMLALVAAYRKIARWEWPGQGMATRPAEEERPRVTNPAAQDTRADEVLRPFAREQGWEGLGEGGDGTGHWLVA